MDSLANIFLFVLTSLLILLILVFFLFHLRAVITRKTTREILSSRTRQVDQNVSTKEMNAAQKVDWTVYSPVMFHPRQRLTHEQHYSLLNQKNHASVYKQPFHNKDMTYEQILQQQVDKQNNNQL